MIISRTPFRISFFGGGTDYPAWYQENGGSVISTSIDKYCYITCRELPPFFEYKHRIVYSKVENVLHTNEIIHPSVRATLNWAKIEHGLEVHHDGDLPARSGMGSSSAFTVGLVNALNALAGRMSSKEYLAESAIHIEQNLIGEHVGSQDQIATAYGGFNKIEFFPGNTFKVTPIIINKEALSYFKSHLMLFFTGFSRIADEIAKSKIENFKSKKNELKNIQGMVDRAVEILTGKEMSVNDFGVLLDDSWKYKRSLSEKVSTPEIDDLYRIAINSGAIGGKLLGAGGGGFLLVFASPERHSKIRESLSKLISVKFEFENSGSTIVLYQPNGF